MKNRILAGLLALILGTFGVHRFYLNDIPGGIFYLFLFFISSKLIFPISSILGIIEAVRIFNMSNAEFDEKYNHGKRVRDKHGRVISHRNVREIRRPKRRKSLFPKKNPFKKVLWKNLKIMILKERSRIIAKHWIYHPMTLNCIFKSPELIL